ncbi:MAG: osmotically inducible protein OsmC [Bacteroidetes bacterium]|jgi:putative redox protein|nr:osmotically inducible protein OsmC [Bacteroidota bacterium]MBT4729554.1 osmotically inducible protein OsmC [Bacteroidota bacterium]MBT5990782.1 osmotically inducible protein OsmC [Bacteroidota bacterium]MBT7994922.1 osmotically inducible protein OsmC [Bacteroidota bacterium]
MELEVYFDGNKKVNAKINGSIIKTDQPVKAGGDGSAPAPFDLFLASIGTCAGIYVKGFCDSRGIDATNIKIIQKHSFNQSTRMIDSIELEAILPADFPEKYKSAIISAMDLCAVKKHLNNPPQFSTITRVANN